MTNFERLIMNKDLLALYLSKEVTDDGEADIMYDFGIDRWYCHNHCPHRPQCKDNPDFECNASDPSGMVRAWFDAECDEELFKEIGV